MRRREFIALLGGAVGLPQALHAQAPEKMRRIAVLMSIPDDREGQRRLRALQEGLAKRGWSEGNNIRIEVDWAVSDAERANAAARELANRAPDLILSSGTPATATLHRANLAIPVVFTVVSEPVEQGFVQSLARPGGNITGFANLEPGLGCKWVELLKEIAPTITRASLVFNPRTAPAALVKSRAMDQAAEKLGLELVRSPVRESAGIEAVIASLRSGTDGFMLPPDTFMNMHRKLVIDLASSHRIAAVYPFSYLAAEGGLASYGIDLADSFRQAAAYVDRIFHGEKPAELPVQQPTKFELFINLKTARALGLTVPATLLARADEVID